LIDAAIDQDALTDAIADINRHRRDIQAILDGEVQPVIDTAEAVELPDAPNEPEPDIDLDAQPDPLADGDESYEQLTMLLRLDRKFGDEDEAGVTLNGGGDEDDDEE
jgi:hypothetical protein